MARCESAHPQDEGARCVFATVPMHLDHIDDQGRIWSDPPPPKPDEVRTSSQERAHRIAGGS